MDDDELMLVALYVHHNLPPDEHDLCWRGKLRDFLDANAEAYIPRERRATVDDLIESNVHFIGGGGQQAFVLIRQVEDPAPNLNDLRTRRPWLPWQPV